MRRFLASGLAACALAVPTLVVAATPANADYATSISPLDTSQLGHVTGTITTAAPYVSVSLLNWAMNEINPVMVRRPLVGGIAFDLETWGYSNAAVSARPCSTADPSSCQQQVLSEWFVPAAPADPVINWPDPDITIGPNQTYAIEVVSDSGGGVLGAHWMGVTDLLTSGLNQYTPRYEGTSEVKIMRCATYGYPCRATTRSRTLTVRRSFPVTTMDYSFGAISPAVGTHLTPKFQTSEGDDFSYEWTVTSPGSNTPLLQGTVEHVMEDGSGVVTPVIDVSPLSDGDYVLTGDLSYHEPDFGRLVGRGAWPVTFTVDTSAPTISSVSVSNPTVYPFDDGYRDSVDVKAKWTPGPADVRIEVINSVDNVLRTIRRKAVYSGTDIGWDGKADNGALVPGGAYELRVTVFDRPAGNPSLPVSQTVTVVRKKLVRHQYRKQLSAAGSLVDQYVGKCSRLVKPSARGWAGSLGLYTNTRCNRAFDDGLVATLHTVRVPRAFRYNGIAVSTTGGAARSKPRSLAYHAYVAEDGDWWHDTRLGPRVATYRGYRVFSSFVLPGRHLYWVVYTAEGAAFDLRSFTVNVNYSVLVAE